MSFSYEFKDGATVEVDELTLSSKEMRRLRKESELEIMYDLMENKLDEKKLEEIETGKDGADRSMTEVSEFFSKWFEDGISGEIILPALGAISELGAEILSLCAFAEEHESAVRRDLLEFGYSLNRVGLPGGMAWIDFRAFLIEAPIGSAVHRSMLDDPEDAGWNLSEQLLATVADGVHNLLWQNGGGNTSDKPKPIERPGNRPEKRKVQGTVLNVDDMAATLGLPVLF